MKIAVTGASGFVGGAVATALVARGHDVTGFGRTPLGWSGPYREWDITTGVLSGHGDFEVVVHAAALADDWAPLARATAVNVDGTRAVINSFADARFVHISTSSVYDAFTPTVTARECDGPSGRFLSHYSSTKARAETLFAGLDAIVLRPHAVYGPGDTTLLPRILEGVRGRRLVLPNGARVAHTLTHIDNLVDAVEVGAASGICGVFNIGDDSAVQLDEMLLELLAKKGRSDVTLSSIPYQAALAAAGSLEALARVSGRRPRLTRYAVSQLGLERTLDIAKARRELGYAPSETTLQGAESW